MRTQTPFFEARYKENLALQTQKANEFNAENPKGKKVKMLINGIETSFEVTKPSEVFMGKACIYVKPLNLIVRL
jgi:hypothetical protein